MGNVCSCCSKRERNIDDLLDGSLEDKLLGKQEDDAGISTADESNWRLRCEELKDEADMSMGSDDDDDDDDDDDGGFKRKDSQKPDANRESLMWDLNDRSTARAAHKEAERAVEEEEDEEAFGSAKEDTSEDEADEKQRSTQKVAEDNEWSIDRLSQLSARSVDDSYASVKGYVRDDGSRVFRDTELDNATDVSDSFVASSSHRDTFLVDDEDEVQQLPKQVQEYKNDPTSLDNSIDKSQNSSNTSSYRRNKKKARKP